MLWVGTASAADAATFVVNQGGDAADVSPGNGICETVAGTGTCTLRAAIQEANALPNGPGPDRIDFNLFGIVGQPRTISPTSALPTITDPLTINGWSQGGTGYVGPPLVELDGSGAGPTTIGLRIRASNTTVQGLIVNRFGSTGISIDAGDGAWIRGCYIGTDATGSTAARNGAHGVAVAGDASNATIGGTGVADRNVISGNGSAGVGLFTEGSVGSRVLGNYIGTNVAGTAAVGNAFRGVLINLSSNHVVGGEEPGARNVISGNAREGISIAGNTVVPTRNNRVLGNFIGMSADLTAPIGNGQAGISITNSDANVIGGTTSTARNVISGNGYGPSGLIGPAFGVYVGGAEARNNVIQGNFIGVGLEGIDPFGNSADNVRIEASENLVGGGASGALNVIANAGLAGVAVRDRLVVGPAVVAERNEIRGNLIFGNGGLGIDLGADGVTVNDGQDADGGPNRRQNFPVLSSAGVGGGRTTVAGTLVGVPSRIFAVDLFANPSCDASGHGEGQSLLGSAVVQTDGSGNGSFVAVLPPANVGQAITATATLTFTGAGGRTGETSEFSACRTAVTANLVVSPATGLRTTEAGGTATFTVALTSTPSADVVVPLASSDASEGSVAPASLTFTRQNAMVPQTVTVRGVDDAQVDGDVGYQVRIGPTTSADPGYNGITPLPVGVTNADNDAGACSPRPNVVLTTAPDGPGRLRVTVTAGTQPATPNNRLVELRFQPGPNANALVDIREQVGRSGAFTYVLADRPSSVVFVVRRATVGQATQLAFVVADTCGDWRTFVGGGAGAF